MIAYAMLACTTNDINSIVVIDGTVYSWPFTQLDFAGLTIGGDTLITWDGFHPSAYQVSLPADRVTPFWLYDENGPFADDIAWLSPAVTSRGPSWPANATLSWPPPSDTTNQAVCHRALITKDWQLPGQPSSRNHVSRRRAHRAVLRASANEALPSRR